MKTLDRLGWAEGLSFGAYGVRVGVRTDRAEILPDLLARLPPGWRRLASPRVDRLYSVIAGGGDGCLRRLSLVYEGSHRIGRSRELPEALDALESALRLHVAEHARGRVFLHAAVVGWRGRAILLPGRSFSGKSTLAAALVRAGASYYSDEYAVLDSSGRVHAYPAPLALRNAAGARIARLSAEALGGSSRREPLPVGLVVLSEFRPRGVWRPRRLSPGRAALEMLAHAVPARRDPARVLATLRRVALDAHVTKGARGEAEATAERLLEMARTA
jgi:hypothetical protein